jgi:GntR family transcriptional repressor for pyruvate dehydrogenase complex
MSDTDIFSVVDNKQRLVDRVVDQITGLIIDKKLSPGTKLPSENKLAESTGVSRTVVREAIQNLIARGMVETHHGVGTIVRRVTGGHISQHLSMLLRLNGLTLDHLHQVRSILEVEVAGLAAAQATDEEIAELDRLIERMESLPDEPVTYAEMDGEFHRSLARITHNPLLVMLYDSINSLMYEVRLAVSHYPSLYHRSLQGHRQITEQIRARSGQRARQAMSDHLKTAREIQQAVEVEAQSK